MRVTPDLLPLWEIQRMAMERGGTFGGVEHGRAGLTLRLSFWTEAAAADFARLLDDRMGGSRPGDARVIGWTDPRRRGSHHRRAGGRRAPGSRDVSDPPAGGGARREAGDRPVAKEEGTEMMTEQEIAQVALVDVLLKEQFKRGFVKGLRERDRTDEEED